MKQKVKSIVTSVRDQYARRGFYSRDKWMVNKFDLPCLTKGELDVVRNAWPFLKVNNRDLIWTRMYKKTYGFNPYFITDYHLNLILRRFNSYDQVISLENKALIDIYFPSIPFPTTYVRCINGTLYDSKMQVLTASEAFSVINKATNSPVIIKPTIETMGGKGVKKIKIEKEDEFKSLIQNRGDNYIIQECLVQSDFLNNLNPTSINSCRVTTINLGNDFDYSSIIKTGRKDSVIDNWNSSYLWGMDKKGEIISFGYDNMLESHEMTDTGIKLKGITYPYFDKIISFVEMTHKTLFPQCGIVGWDVLIDINNEVRVIEANLSTPGVVGEQYCAGVAFFEKFRDYIVSKIK